MIPQKGWYRPAIPKLARQRYRWETVWCRGIHVGPGSKIYPISGYLKYAHFLIQYCSCRPEKNTEFSSPRFSAIANAQVPRDTRNYLYFSIPFLALSHDVSIKHALRRLICFQTSATIRTWVATAARTVASRPRHRR